MTEESAAAEERTRDHRLSERYPVQLVGSVSLGRSSRLRRRRVEEVDVILADVSVSGASILGPANSGLASIVPGADIELTVGGHRGTVRVRHAARRGDWTVLGVEFEQLSPELRDVVFHAVERWRDGGAGQLTNYWSTAT